MTAGEWISLIGLVLVIAGACVSAGVLIGELRSLAKAIDGLAQSVKKLDAKLDSHAERLARLEAGPTRRGND